MIEIARPSPSTDDTSKRITMRLPRKLAALFSSAPDEALTEEEIAPARKRIFHVNDDTELRSDAQPPAQAVSMKDQLDRMFGQRDQNASMNRSDSPSTEQRVNAFFEALETRRAVLRETHGLLEREPNREIAEDRTVLIFCAVQHVGCHVEYVAELTSLDYGYVERVLTRMHEAGIWPPIGTVGQAIPMTADQCADLAIICDEDLHGRASKAKS